MYKILDCTLRDGGYINNWKFTDQFLENYINIMNNNDIDYVEIGFLNKTKEYKNYSVGSLRNLNEEPIEMFKNNKFKISVMADYEDINLELLYKNLPIDLVRIAFHKNNLEKSLIMCQKIKNLGYKVSVNAMAITNYNNQDLKYLFDFINKNNLDMLYIADSYGSLNQKDIKYYIKLFQNNLKTAKIGLHLHNNMNNAFSNFESLSNINLKNNIFIDTTLFGMGRGAGNLQTELVLIHKNPKINFDNLIEFLIFIQNFIKPIYKCDENHWGYDLDYLLSGYLKMHPNYIVKMRDLNINMENRFILIKLLKENYNYKLFDKEIMEELIYKYRDIIL